MAKPRTPFEEYAEKTIREAKATARMDHELAKYGKPVQAGMVWSVGDLHRYFTDQDKKKRKR